MRGRLFLFAAPAIVAAPSLMKISALAMPPRAAFWDIPHSPAIYFDEPTVSDLIRRLSEIADAQDQALAEVCGIPSILLGTQNHLTS